jgi:hypothetical protein
MILGENDRNYENFKKWSKGEPLKMTVTDLM